jgi:hypothetical protein
MAKIIRSMHPDLIDMRKPSQGISRAARMQATTRKTVNQLRTIKSESV